MTKIARIGLHVNIDCICYCRASTDVVHPDDPEVYDGAPVGLQLMARKHEEEKVWAIAKIVDAALRTSMREGT